MNTRHLKTFIVTAECGSMAAAAQQLYISPPALQQQINILEKEAGARLLNRTPRGITLTEAGQIFLDGARRILNEVDSLTRAVARTSQHTPVCVRVGAIRGLVPDYYPAINQAFLRAYPGIDQKPFMEDEDTLFHMLDAGQLDVIEYYESPRAHEAGRRFQPLVREGRMCVMSAIHPLANRSVLRPEDLEGYTLSPFKFERVYGLKEYLETNYPGITLEEGRNPATFYELLRGFDAVRISLAPPHCAAAFSPLVCIPFDVNGMTWDSGLVYSENAGEAALKYLQVAKEVFGWVDG